MVKDIQGREKLELRLMKIRPRGKRLKNNNLKPSKTTRFPSSLILSIPLSLNLLYSAYLHKNDIATSLKSV